jgi:hypothetical protein
MGQAMCQAPVSCQAGLATSGSNSWLHCAAHAFPCSAMRGKGARAARLMGSSLSSKSAYHTFATDDSPNAQCAGLGYYRRARYLLDGAKYIVGQLDGSFPTTAQELQSIPGA